MEVLVYGADNVTTSKRREFQVRLKCAREAATKWSEGDRNRAIQQLEGEIHQMTPVKPKLFDKLFQHHKRQQFQEVATKVIRSTHPFPNKHAQMKTNAKEAVDGAVNMTADKRVPLQVHLSDAETEATPWSMADTDRIVSLLEREIYGITSNEQMRFREKFSIPLIQFEAWWQAIGVQELWKPIQQREIHFGYAKLHLGSHISQSIQ
jgi:hypothetical protein